MQWQNEWNYFYYGDELPFIKKVWGESLNYSWKKVKKKKNLINVFLLSKDWFQCTFSSNKIIMVLILLDTVRRASGN